MKVFIILVTLVLLSNCKTLTLSCGDCSISCSSGNKCYKMVGDGFNEEECANTNVCTFSATITYEIESCQTDFLSVQCPDKVCVSPNNVLMCYDTSQFGGSCPTISYAYSCRSCQSTSGCTSCFLGAGNSDQICMDQYWEGVCNWSMSMNIGSCSGDAFGTSCNCCMDATYDGIGICATNDPIFASKAGKLGSWANQNWIRMFGIAAIAFVMLIVY